MFEREAQSALLDDMPTFESGWVWLVGAGPGDPGLLTLHAVNALANADAVVYDALVDTRILNYARPGATVEYAGKRGGKPSPKQRDISLRLVELASAGAEVAVLTKSKASDSNTEWAQGGVAVVLSDDDTAELRVTESSGL